MIWNEAGDWVFSDDAHEWMDGHAQYGSYRPGGPQLVEQAGWGVGLATIKEDDVSENIDISISAKWPVPYKARELDVVDEMWGVSTRWML